MTLSEEEPPGEIARIEWTPLDLGGERLLNLDDLRASLLSLDVGAIQPYSDNDIISSWLDRKGYPELAEELRPIHGSGPELCQTLVDIVGKWITHLPRARLGS